MKRFRKRFAGVAATVKRKLVRRKRRKGDLTAKAADLRGFLKRAIGGGD